MRYVSSRTNSYGSIHLAALAWGYKASCKVVQVNEAWSKWDERKSTMLQTVTDSRGTTWLPYAIASRMSPTKFLVKECSYESLAAKANDLSHSKTF